MTPSKVANKPVSSLTFTSLRTHALYMKDRVMTHSRRYKSQINLRSLCDTVARGFGRDHLLLNLNKSDMYEKERQFGCCRRTSGQRALAELGLFSQCSLSGLTARHTNDLSGKGLLLSSWCIIGGTTYLLTLKKIYELMFHFYVC